MFVTIFKLIVAFLIQLIKSFTYNSFMTVIVKKNFFSVLKCSQRFSNKQNKTKRLHCGRPARVAFSTIAFRCLPQNFQRNPKTLKMSNHNFARFPQIRALLFCSFCFFLGCYPMVTLFLFSLFKYLNEISEILLWNN